MQTENISLDKVVLEKIFSGPALPEVSDEEIQAVLDCGEMVRLKHGSGNTNSSQEATAEGALKALGILVSRGCPQL
jgi:hypothetical protein